MEKIMVKLTLDSYGLWFLFWRFWGWVIPLIFMGDGSTLKIFYRIAKYLANINDDWLRIKRTRNWLIDEEFSSVLS